jgi:hypothetical protein
MPESKSRKLAKQTEAPAAEKPKLKLKSHMTLIKCAGCGKEVRRVDAYPNRHTKVKPKPKLAERYLYCESCWRSRKYVPSVVA